MKFAIKFLLQSEIDLYLLFHKKGFLFGGVSGWWLDALKAKVVFTKNIVSRPKVMI